MIADNEMNQKLLRREKPLSPLLKTPYSCNVCTGALLSVLPSPNILWQDFLDLSNLPCEYGTVLRMYLKSLVKNA